MGTAVGVRGKDGVALAADRRIVVADTVQTEEFDHLLTFDGVIVAIVGTPGPAKVATRDLEGAFREYRLAHDRGPGLAPCRRIVSEQVSAQGISALLAARDADGQAGLVQVDPEGGTVTDQRLAIGEGRAVAIGLLESVNISGPIADLATELESVMTTVAERVVSVGSRVDTAVLADGS